MGLDGAFTDDFAGGWIQWAFEKGHLSDCQAGLINHEYQHDCWVGEVRQALGHGDPPSPLSTSPCLLNCDGYWVMDLTLAQERVVTRGS